MMRFFLISILLFTLASCKSYQPVGVIKTITENSTYQNTYFAFGDAYLYKASVEVYGNQLSGIIVIKKMDSLTHRIALTSAFGNTLMDITLSDKDMKVNYILKEMNRKILLKTLESDFRMILTINHLIQEKMETPENVIYKARNKDGFYYFFNGKENNNLNQIILANKTKEKVKVNIRPKNRTFAEEIVIQHTTIKLRIVLNEYQNE